MRALHILPLTLIGMVGQAAAQTMLDATNPPSPQRPVVSRPADTQPCNPWLEACPRDDRHRILLFLGLVSATTRPPAFR